VVEGFAEGEAIVTRHAISGFGGIDSKTGEIVEVRHELRGQSFKGKVLVFPGAKGSSGWASHFQSTRLAGRRAIAMIFNMMSTKMALGAVVTPRALPSPTLDQDPIEVIKSGRLGEGGRPQWGGEITPQRSGGMSVADRFRMRSWSAAATMASPAAPYLSKAGKKVLVLEQKDVVGGAAVTEEFSPGFSASTYSFIMGHLHPR
jgi:predicted aconitase with swiveling domain